MAESSFSSSSLVQLNTRYSTTRKEINDRSSIPLLLLSNMENFSKHRSRLTIGISRQERKINQRILERNNRWRDIRNTNNRNARAFSWQSVNQPNYNNESPFLPSFLPSLPSSPFGGKQCCAELAVKAVVGRA